MHFPGGNDHGIEHDHAHHTHEHTHSDGVTHTHDHSHEGDHVHEHAHSHGEAGFDSVEQAQALMSYMLEHNRHHAEELHDTAHKLDASGRHDAAEKIHEAYKQYEVGNDVLAEALKLLKEGE